MHPSTLKRDTAVDAMWLTDPTVPHARPVWATRRSRFRTKRAPAWIPQETTMWWDVRNNIIYVADGNELTDFSSTPAGDGHEGVLRGAGRLHDLMVENTEVYVPRSSSSKGLLLQVAHMARKENRLVTHEELVKFCRYARTTRDVSIWNAGRLYSRMLRSAGFRTLRAVLQRAGLRFLGLQHVYRWAWAGNDWTYAGERKISQ